MDAAVAALLGAALGAIGSVGGVWLTQRAQSRRELLKTAADLGLVDHQLALTRITAQGGALPPLSMFVAYHAEVLVTLAKNEYDEAAVKRIDTYLTALIKAAHDPTKKAG